MPTAIPQGAGDAQGWPGFADPDYEISIDWLAARDAIRERNVAMTTPTKATYPDRQRVSRSEQTCPGECPSPGGWSARRAVLSRNGVHSRLLDLSRTTSEFGKQIHPCKSCVSTSMALCHWPCSCYPNYALGQTDDWMNEIYPLWVAAQGIMIVTPVNWYHAPSGLKAMMDRLVCADGGNPDPSSTHGKKAAEAKALELNGWPYPRHLAGRTSGWWCMATASVRRRCGVRWPIG